jgi:hypothetical protein
MDVEVRVISVDEEEAWGRTDFTTLVEFTETGRRERLTGAFGQPGDVFVVRVAADRRDLKTRSGTNDDNN